MQQEDVSVQLEALDILSDLLSRFGSQYFIFFSLLVLDNVQYCINWWHYCFELCLFHEITKNQENS